MRYSVFEYSQEKLVSLGLDVVDALLLNWFANFFCGKMEKKIFKDTDGNSKIYGWVKISKIIEDLPVIGITSEKGIRIRFDSFVEKGILDRETINTQKGKKSFYRTTSVYDSLINTVAIEKVQEKTEETSENSQRNCTTFAEEKCTETQENISQRKKTTYAKNEIENKNEKSPQRNCSSLADRNCTTLGQRNCSSLALNNSLFNDSLNINSSTTDKKDSAADFLIKKINEIFNHSISFSQDLGKKLLDSLSKSNISEIDYENYIQWAFNHLKQRCEKQENFPGYFYKSIPESALMYKFTIFNDEKLKKEQEAERQMIICPICGDKHNIYDTCKQCGNNYYDIKNDTEEQLSKLKKIYLLGPEKRAYLDKELQDVYNEYPNIFEVINNPELKKELNSRIFEIEKKYGLYEEDYGSEKVIL